MSDSLQNILAISIVTICVIYLLVRAYRTFFSRSKNCGCGSPCAANEPKVISIQLGDGVRK